MRQIRVYILIMAFLIGMPFSSFAFSARTPESLSSFLLKDFVFVDDQSQFGKADYWQTSEEFLKNKKGDCEDFAIFATEFLNREHIQSLIVSVYGANGLAHTVTVFIENSRYRIMDRGEILTPAELSIEKTLSLAYPEWTWACLALPSHGRGRAIKTFKNPNLPT